MGMVLQLAERGGALEQIFRKQFGAGTTDRVSSR